MMASSSAAARGGGGDRRSQQQQTSRRSLYDEILPRLRPFQREAVEFATEGKRHDRQLNVPSTSTATTTTNDGKDDNISSSKAESFNYSDPSLLGIGRILLADEMGCGKTITALAIMAKYASSWPLLVICPPSLKQIWPAEIEKFLPSLPAAAIHIVAGFQDVKWTEKLVGRRKDKGKDTSIQVVVLPFSLVQKRSAVAHLLKDLEFQCIIVDESHNLRDHKSQRTDLLLPVLIRARRLVLLSGTPALARPVELWPQLYCLSPKLFGSYWPFAKRYCDPRKRNVPGGRGRGTVLECKGATNTAELHAKLQQVMVRRLKSDVLSELPPKQRSLVPVAIADTPQRSESKRIIQELGDQSGTDSAEDAVLAAVAAMGGGDNWNSDNNSQSADTARATLMKAYQASGIAKAPAVADYLLDWLSGSNEKILVFAHHRQVLDYIDGVLLSKRPNSHIRIDGGVPSNVRGQLVNKFQTCPRIRVALLGMTAAGTGLTLTAASAVLFAELNWTPGILAQAEDRAHRIGSTHASVQILYLVCRDRVVSIDMTLWKMLGRKIGTVNQIVDGTNDTPYLYTSQQVEAPATQQRTRTVQEEVSSFFAETAAAERGRQKKVPVKGTIESLFRKHQQQKEATSSVNSANTSSTRTSASRLPSTDEEKEEASWSCDRCTFLNTTPSIRRSCEMCGYENKDPNLDTSLSDDDEKKPSARNHHSIINKAPSANSSVVSSKRPARVSLVSDVICLDGTDSAKPSAGAARGGGGRLDNSDDSSDSSSDDLGLDDIQNKSSKRSASSRRSGTQSRVASKPLGAAGRGRLGSDSDDSDSDDSDLNDFLQRPVFGKGTASSSVTRKAAPSARKGATVGAASRTTTGKNHSRVSVSASDVICLDGAESFVSANKARRSSNPSEVIEIDCDDDDEMATKPSSLDENPPDSSDMSIGEKEKSAFKFSVSRNSGRITVHDAGSDTALGNFDLKNLVTNESADRILDAKVKKASVRVPILSVQFQESSIQTLQRDLAIPFDSKRRFSEEVKLFVTSWLSLSEIEKKVLKDSAQAVPAASLSRSVSVLRQENTYTGTDRYIGGAKERAQERTKDGAATENDADVLEGRACAWCSIPLPVASRRAGATYCSQQCAEDGRLRRGGMYSSVQIRCAVFARDLGVCQLCNLNCHTLYEQIRALEPPMRLNKLLRANWQLPRTKKAVDRLLQNPREGDFWQADHARAVAEGGGGCGLDNLRTLCVPCHHSETEKLHGRLRLKSPPRKDGEGDSRKRKQCNLSDFLDSSNPGTNQR